MARPEPTVDGYLAAQPPPARSALLRVRAAVKRAVPAAEETISYGIPAFRLDGRVLLYFAGWKEHYAIYPVTAAVAALGDAVEAHRASKGTLRFPLAGRVPTGLVARIARVRAREVAERASARKAGRPARRGASPKAAGARRARRSTQ